MVQGAPPLPAGRDHGPPKEPSHYSLAALNSAQSGCETKGLCFIAKNFLWSHEIQVSCYWEILSRGSITSEGRGKESGSVKASSPTS